MSLDIEHLPEMGQIKLAGTLSGAFTFAFSKACHHALPTYARNDLVIHMGGVEYIDTSALGALLLLHQHASEQKTKLHLKRCNPIVKELLSIADFSKLFAFID